MVITYHGDNYFKLQSGDFVVLIDPTNQRSFRGTQIILNTIKPPKAEMPKKDDGEKLDYLWIDHQGEYEKRGIKIKGLSQGGGKEEKTIYHLNFDEINFGILGYLNQEPDPKIYSFLDGVDVLVLPAGGKPFIEIKSAVKIIKQLEPALVIPSLFKDLNPFLKEMGQKKGEAEERLVIKKRDLEPKKMKVVWLKA